MSKTVTRYALNDLLQPTFIEQIMIEGRDRGLASTKLDDGSTIEMHIRKLIMNSIYWRVYRKFGQPITKDRVFPLLSYNDETDLHCYNKIYKELIFGRYGNLTEEQYKAVMGPDATPREVVINGDFRDPFYGKDMFHMALVAEIFLGKDYIKNFITRHLRRYQGTIDTLSLAQLFSQKPLQKFNDVHVDSSLGTGYAEKQLDILNNELHIVLSNPKSGLINNFLRPFMSTKLLKRNQLPQMFIAYGCRSDITDEMMKSVISSSAMLGHKDVTDYGIEALSAKKSAFFNSEVIEDAQYFARKCRLVGSQLPKIYEGWCGSTVTIEIEIPQKFMKNFVGKIIVDGKKDVILTRENIRNYVGIPVRMYSPFGCRHTDGVCNHCAGFMYGLLDKFVPPGIHIGVFSATKAVSAITQLILSAKHLIRTLSKVYNIPIKALKYLVKHNDGIMWNGKVAEMMNRISIKIPADAIGTLTDLTQRNLPVSESFTKISYFDVMLDGKFVERVNMEDGASIPFLSSHALMHMKKMWKRLKITPDDVEVPLEGYDPLLPWMKYTVMNDDMVSFVKCIQSFLSTKITDYHSIPLLLRDFLQLLYRKTDIDVFHVEMLLRAFMITNPDDYSIPVINDTYDNVWFGDIADVINEAALSTKLSYERMDGLFEYPRPTLEPMREGMNDRYFGF